MPYTWTHPPREISPQTAYGPGAAPSAQLKLTAHNSLTPEGFVWFFGTTGVLMTMPLFPLLGSYLYYGILTFMVLTLFGAWTAVKISWKRGSVREDLDIWSDHLRLTRTNPDGSVQDWEANPYWVNVVIHERGCPVPHYVTLCGAGRDVEIGAFLSADERKTLAEDLNAMLGRLRAIPSAP